MTNYRICRISRVAYMSAINNLYEDRPELKSASSEDQKNAFFAEHLIYSDSFKREMTKIGNDAYEILCNADRIQKAWARENGVRYSEENWIRDILFAQIEKIRPDVIYIQGLSSDREGFLPDRGFRDQFPFVKLVVGYSGFTFDAARLEGIDLVISCIPFLQQYFAAQSVSSYLVYHGFDEAVLPRLEQRELRPERAYDIVFTGTSGVGHGYSHSDRYWELVQMFLGTSIEGWPDDRVAGPQQALPKEIKDRFAQELATLAEKHSPQQVAQFLRTALQDIYNTEDPIVPLSALFPDRCHPPVYGLEMYDVLRQGKITHNRHTNAMGLVFGNIRLFEATGVGSCLLVNTADNVRDLFEPDAEIVTYASIDECIEKSRYLLEHEDERRSIAAAGQKRTLSDHTIQQRCAQIHQIVSQALRQIDASVNAESGSPSARSPGAESLRA